MYRVLLIASLAIPLPLAAVDPPQVTAWKEIYQAFQDPNPDHRRQALLALAVVGSSDERAVKLAERLIKNDKDPQVRAGAAMALGEMKATDAIPTLQEALKDTNEVAFAAAKALANMGDASGREMLIAVLSKQRSDSPGILANAKRDAMQKLRHPRQLALMGAENTTGAFFPPASMGLMAVDNTLQMKGKSSRAMAVTYLAKDPDPYAVTVLEWALADDDVEVRVAAAKGLAERGNGHSIPKLQFLLDDGHSSVRTMAGAAILRISRRERPAEVVAERDAR
jgi:HEAT repeat protein